MSDAERLKAFEEVLRGSHWFVLNMNDTFGFACGDSEEMDVADFDAMVPLLSQYGQDALTAYAALKRQQEPIDCKCNYKNERYLAAMAAIKDMLIAQPCFMSGYGR